MQTGRADEFAASVLQAVDECFLALGESVRHTVYYWLGTNYSLKKEKILGKLVEFDRTIQKLFSLGAEMVEKVIVRKLCERFDIDPKKVDGLDFQPAIRTIRKGANRPV